MNKSFKSIPLLAVLLLLLMASDIQWKWVNWNILFLYCSVFTMYVIATCYSTGSMLAVWGAGIFLLTVQGGGTVGYIFGIVAGVCCIVFRFWLDNVNDRIESEILTLNDFNSIGANDNE